MQKKREQVAAQTAVVHSLRINETKQERARDGSCNLGSTAASGRNLWAMTRCCSQRRSMKRFDTCARKWSSSNKSAGETNGAEGAFILTRNQSD